MNYIICNPHGILLCMELQIPDQHEYCGVCVCLIGTEKWEEISDCIANVTS